MPDTVILILSALLLFAVGGLAGFWFGQQRGREDAARSGELQQEFDAYRRHVAEHFGETAGHFRSLGKQVRALYDHMADGADTLVDEQSTGRRIEFSATAPLEPPADDERNETKPEEVESAKTSAEEVPAEPAEKEESTADAEQEEQRSDSAGDEDAKAARKNAPGTRIPMQASVSMMRSPEAPCIEEQPARTGTDKG